MQMDLKNIIDKIKEEGVDEADKKSKEIVKEAEDKANEIMRSAETQKEEIINKAQKEAEKLNKNTEEALRQAARDVLLGLRSHIISLFDKVTKEKVAESLSKDILQEMVVRLAEGVGKNGELSIEVLLSEKDKQALEEVLLKALRDKIKQGVTIKASDNVESGFRLGEKGGAAYYDFSDEAIAEAFNSFLNQRVLEILTPGANKE